MHFNKIWLDKIKDREVNFYVCNNLTLIISMEMKMISDLS